MIGLDRLFTLSRPFLSQPPHYCQQPNSNKFAFNQHPVVTRHVSCLKPIQTSNRTSTLDERRIDVSGEEVEGGNGNLYDAIVIGSGIGGLVAATQLAVKGARVLVLEKYVIPGGSSGYYKREGYTFDVGSSVMFGFSDKVRFNISSLGVRWL